VGRKAKKRTLRIEKLSILSAIAITLVIGGVSNWHTAVIIAPAKRTPNRKNDWLKNTPMKPTSRNEKKSFGSGYFPEQR